jgi:hypothetical protein
MAMFGKWIASLRKVEMITLRRAWKQPSGEGLHGRLQAKVLTEPQEPMSRNPVLARPLGLRAFREQTLCQAQPFIAQRRNVQNFFSSNDRIDTTQTYTPTNTELIKVGSVVWLPLHEATSRKNGRNCRKLGITGFVHSKWRPHIVAQVYFRHYVAVPITTHRNSGVGKFIHCKDVCLHTRVRDSKNKPVTNLEGGTNGDSSQDSEVMVELGSDNMPLYVTAIENCTKIPMSEKSYALMGSPVTYHYDIPFTPVGSLDEDSKERFLARYKKVSEGLGGLKSHSTGHESQPAGLKRVYRSKH